jgi:hypothetical protein
MILALSLTYYCSKTIGILMVLLYGPLLVLGAVECPRWLVAERSGKPRSWKQDRLTRPPCGKLRFLGKPCMLIVVKALPEKGNRDATNMHFAL